jgi:hypothetical protein
VPVSFRGHAAALMRKRVPVRAVGIANGVVVSEPDLDDACSWPLPLLNVEEGAV